MHYTLQRIAKKLVMITFLFAVNSIGNVSYKLTALIYFFLIIGAGELLMFLVYVEYDLR